MATNDQNRSARKWLKRGVVGLALASALTWGYKTIQPNAVTPRAAEPAVAESNYDPDILFLHLKEGKTLDDVELLHDDSDNFEFNETIKDADLKDFYVVDPTKESDLFIDQIIADLEADTDVLDAEFNSIHHDLRFKGDGLNLFVDLDDPLILGTDLPNDPLYQKGFMWGQEVTNMDRVHSILQEYVAAGGELHKVKVAVIDTGIDKNHEDLKVAGGKNFAGLNPDPDKWGDPNSHGTHVAGSYAAFTNNEKGVSSIDSEGLTELYAVRVLTKWGAGTKQMILNGIKEAAKLEVKIANMSLGGKGSSRTYEKAIKFAQDKGVIFYVASGNDNRDFSNFTPANVKGVIPIAAVGYDGENVSKAKFSNYGEEILLACPGVDIASTVPMDVEIPEDKEIEPGYASYPGTSMATPYCGGLGAILSSVKPDLTRDELVELQQSTGFKPETEEGKHIGMVPLADGALKSLIRTTDIYKNNPEKFSF